MKNKKKDPVFSRNSDRKRLSNSFLKGRWNV